MFLYILPEYPAKLSRQKDPSAFALTVDFGLAAVHRLDGDVSDLRHADTGGADRLHQKVQPLVVFVLGGAQQAAIIVFCQLPVGGCEDLLLNFEVFDPEVVPLHKPKKAVKRRQRRVDARRGVVLAKIGFICDDRCFAQFRSPEP